MTDSKTEDTLAIVIVSRHIMLSDVLLGRSRRRMCPLRFHPDYDFHSATSFASRIRVHSACWTPSVGSYVMPRPCHSREIFTRRGRAELEISVDPAPMRDDADGEKREKRRWLNVCVRGVMSSIDRRDQPANLPLCGPFQPLCDIVCSPPPRRQRELAELSSSSSSCHNDA